MPLVLHESSSCDVCLDGYSWLTPDDTPHAIPCGHIFCRSCLVNVEPSNCPLCRKAFNRERIKKLHVDRAESDAERNLLHRLALAFDAPTDEQTTISEELTAWLEVRPEDDHAALRKAWSAFKEYNKLNDRRQHDRQKIKRSERMIQQLNEDREYDRDTHKAVESSLLAQVSELTAQIADLEAQVNPLRNELSKYQHTANPLPPPPEPVPLDRFPPFARATAESKEGYASYFTPGGAHSFFPSNSPHTDPPVDAGADKGKGKAKVKQPPYIFANPPANMIIPGASPSQRVVPGEDATSHAYHTHAPASAYVDGYANGFGQGYGAANAGLTADTAHASTSYHPDTNHASTSAYQLPPRAEEHEDFLEEGIGSLRLWGVPSASEAAIATRPQPDSASTTMPLRRRLAYLAPSHASTADDMSTISHADNSYTRPSALRRTTVQLDGHLPNGRAPSAWHPPSIYAAPAPPAHSDPVVHFDTQAQDENAPNAHDATARRTTHERNRLNRQSYSSWGTVHTNDSPAARTGGSMSEFGGLVSFPQAPTQRNSMSSVDGILDRGLTATPRQEDPRVPLGFVAASPVPAQLRPGHAHSYSLPANALPTLGDADAPVSYDANSLQRSTRINNRQRTVPRRFSQLPVGASEFGVVATALPREPPPLENALGLELGMEAAPALPTITAPTPRVQMAPFLRSWSNHSLDPTVR